jgi:hypothetical protein
MLRNLVLVGGLLLAACATTPVAVVQPDIAVAIPPIDPLTLSPVQWQVMTLPQLKQLVATMEASNSNVSVFVLDSKDYTNLSLNMTQLERYITQQQAVLTMLKTIIADRSAQSQVNH